MSSFILSWTLGADFAWPHYLAWNAFVFVLLFTPAYFVWSKWTSRVADALEPRDNTSSDQDDISISGDSDENTPNGTSKQEKKGKSRCRDNDRTSVTDSRKKKSICTDYTVGWICAISTEHVAALEFLDEVHEGLENIPYKDDNDYTLGKIGKHNVVVVVLPIGEYGTTAAASVAKDLSRTFPNIRIGLMVGIGGGAPSKNHDIRLGDIVVSAPGNGNGGVFQYDFGKTIQGRAFHITGFLNQPPVSLRTAVNALRTRYTSKRHQFDEDISSIIEKNPRLQGFKRPHPSTDRLYQTEIAHPLNNKASCATCCGTSTKQLVTRRERLKYEDNPSIHYGLIASSNQVMKDALIRDKLIAQKDVLCFEMEAAGLMNQFPCLVIRGICDYADSHKNKEWQGYAAMAAAAYAKDLLLRIPPNAVKAEDNIGDILSDLLGTAQKQLEIQEDTYKRKQSEEEKKCLQLFRLTDRNKDITYEWYKNRVEKRVEGTCQWFLQHHHFQEWLYQDSGPLLVSADPGCGKSVLARYLIEELPKYMVDRGLQSPTICYFFFKENDQNTVRQALCALLHQLFDKRPSLIDHAMLQLHKDGQGLINSTQSLWTILGNAVKDPQSRPIILVLDALDECAEADLEDLVRNMKSQFSSDKMGHNKLKYLLTCRPYETIVSQFRDHDLLMAFPNICIPGEEESEAISKEVNYVIKYRVNRLSEMKRLSHDIKTYLERRLQDITHRTYLWIYLVFNYLEKENFKRTQKGINTTIRTIPKSVNEAYEQILNKSKEEERSVVKKALSIILAASRPLTLLEMNIAMHIDSASKSIHDIDLEDNESFKTRLRSWCGLFVSIHQGRVYFLHQTVREFLLADLASPTPIPLGIYWHHSFTTCQAHTVLAKICVLYLNLFDSDDGFQTGASWDDTDYDVGLPMDATGDSGHPIDARALLDYSAKSWAAHFREACIIDDDDAILPLALKICDPGSRSYSAWFRLYWTTISSITEKFTHLAIASYLGHWAVVKLLLERGADIEATCSTSYRTPLSWAVGVEWGSDAIVKLLLEKGADTGSRDKYGRSPLWRAASYRNEAAVRLLLEKGADIESRDENGLTPLSRAATDRNENVVKLLLEKGADIESRDENGQTPLSWAAANGAEATVKLLLEKGADIESRNTDGLTPLSRAATDENENVVKLLLDKGADIESRDAGGQTPLSWAAVDGNEAAVKLLIEKGADIESRDRYGQTPLSWAAVNGNEVTVRLLLEEDADIETRDVGGQTPLSWAAVYGKEVAVRLLLEKGADIESKDAGGRTPLSQAVGKKSWCEVINLLLEKGADIKSRDAGSQTPLSWAVIDGNEVAVKLLLEKGADGEAQIKSGRTPLFYAAERGRDAVVTTLATFGVNLNVEDTSGLTALQLASFNSHDGVEKILLSYGAAISPDFYGLRTLFSPQG